MKQSLAYGKITLRLLEPEDVNLLYQWENNIEIWDLSNTKAPFSKHILKQYIEASTNDIYITKQLRLIIQNEKDEAVGAIDLFDFEPYHQRAGVGILIHKKENRNSGYATDAIIALSIYAAEVLGVRQLYASITSDNKNSIKLFEKCGFEKSGIKRNWIRTNSGWKDEIFYQKMLSS